MWGLEILSLCFVDRCTRTRWLYNEQENLNYSMKNLQVHCKVKQVCVFVNGICQQSTNLKSLTFYIQFEFTEVLRWEQEHSKRKYKTFLISVSDFQFKQKIYRKS
jgi:hypothetical protein